MTKQTPFPGVDAIGAPALADVLTNAENPAHVPNRLAGMEASKAAKRMRAYMRVAFADTHSKHSGWALSPSQAREVAEYFGATFED